MTIRRIQASLSARLAPFFRDSLYRNSVFLMVNTGGAAALGFLFWVVAARLFTPEAVGQATAALILMGLVSDLSLLGLPRTAVRFLGRSADPNTDITTKLAIVAGSSLLLALGALALLPILGDPLTPWLAIVFVLTCMAFAVKVLLDSVFVALRSANHTLTANLTASVARIVLVGAVTWAGYIGLLSAQLLGTMLALIVSYRLLRSRHGFRLARPAASTMHGRWRFSLGSYSADLIGGLPIQAVPLTIAVTLGPIATASWFVSMQLVLILFLLCGAINQSLFAEASNAEDQLGSQVRRTSRMMFAVVVPAVAVLVLFAGPVLHVFGPVYAEAAPAVRVLALSALLVVGSQIASSVLALRHRVGYLTAVNAVAALVIIPGVFLFGETLLQCAVIWLVGEAVKVLLLVAGAVLSGRRGSAAA